MFHDEICRRRITVCPVGVTDAKVGDATVTAIDVIHEDSCVIKACVGFGAV